MTARTASGMVAAVLVPVLLLLLVLV
ncbi:MAG: hypothetical protein RLZZ177_2695, partial [Pseudomonadota bacterium]